MKKGDHTYLAHDSDSIESEINEEIFNQKFKVEPLIDPVSFLPQYEQQRRYEPTCNEQCLNCCGNICMICAAPCGLCGCTCCAYKLPTSYGIFSNTQLASLKLLVNFQECSSQD